MFHRKFLAHVTAKEYDLSSLLPLLQRHFEIMPYINDDVLHVRVNRDCLGSLWEFGRLTNDDRLFNEPLTFSETDENPGEIFIFLSGTFVTWGLSPQIGELFLRTIIKNPCANIERQVYADVDTEEMEYVYDPRQVGGKSLIRDNMAVIGTDLEGPLSKLAFSHGLARSAKLSYLEASLDQYLERTGDFSASFMKGKKINLSRAEIRRRFGELLSFRQQLNLHSRDSFLDTPDFYWSRPELEELYHAMSKAHDVRPRISILNKKIDYGEWF